MNILKFKNASSFVAVDLSWPLHPEMPVWPGDPRTELEARTAIAREGYFLNRLSVGEHTGTHIGSANHYLAKGRTVAQTGLSHLVAPAIKINCRTACQKNNEYRLDVADFKRWEQRYGKIPARHWLLVETGWSRYWSGRHSDKYWHAFPGITEAAAELLCAKRKIIGIGIDSAGVDGSAGQDLATGRCLAHHGRLHLENLNRLHRLPNTGCILFIGALAIVSGSGSPCRVLALCPDRIKTKRRLDNHRKNQ
jgi:kynurenine formamidase